MDDKLTSETEFVVLGRALSVETEAHWDAKKVWKWFAFSLEFDMKLFLTKIGEINGIFLPL